MLLAEIKDLRVSAEQLYFSFDRLLNIGLVFVVGIAGLAVADRDELLVLAPLPAYVVTLLFLNLNTEGLSRAGHKRWLEERVNQLVANGPCLEEAVVAPTRQGPLGARPSVYATQGLVGVSLVVVSVAAARVALAQELWIQIVFFIALSYAVGALLLAVAELRRAYPSAYEASKAHFTATSRAHER